MRRALLGLGLVMAACTPPPTGDDTAVDTAPTLLDDAQRVLDGDTVLAPDGSTPEPEPPSDAELRAREQVQALEEVLDQLARSTAQKQADHDALPEQHPDAHVRRLDRFASCRS